MKAEYAVGTDAEMGELLESQSLKVSYYLDTVLDKTNEAGGPQECRVRVPSHWNFLLHEKLKSWWDEYQEWRKEGRHLKRRKLRDRDEMATATGNQTPAFADQDVQVAPPNALDPSQIAAPQQQQQQPHPSAIPTSSFALGNAYPAPAPWNANDLTLDTQPISDQTAFTTDMGDFSAAFQNGDLYLWNDMTADNFGGWVPQGGSYGGGAAGFGGMNSHGF
jgi:hypothetical protein